MTAPDYLGSMMTLAALAATAAEQRPSGETQRRRENRMMAGINAQMGRIGADNWRAVWAGLSKDGANFAYIATNESEQAVALVIRGTILAPIDLLEDLEVGSLVEFTAIPAAYLTEPLLVSQGAMLAFTEIMSTVSVEQQTNLLQALLPLVTASTKTLYITGHSLGGCIASMIALYLATSGAFGSTPPSFVACTFAAPTAGLAAFANCYDKWLTNGKGNAAWRVYNAYDAVPNAWASLSNVEEFYPYDPGPGPQANDTVSGLIKQIAQSANNNSYVQTNQNSNSMELNSGYTVYDPGLTCKTVNDFLGQMAFQHANDTYLTLLGAPLILTLGPVVTSVSPNNAARSRAALRSPSTATISRIIARSISARCRPSR